MKTGIYQADIENGVYFEHETLSDADARMTDPMDFLDSCGSLENGKIAVYLDASIEYDQGVFEVLDEEYGVKL